MVVGEIGEQRGTANVRSRGTLAVLLRYSLLRGTAREHLRTSPQAAKVALCYQSGATPEIIGHEQHGVEVRLGVQ